MIEKYFVDKAYKKVQLEDFFKKNLRRAGFNKLELVKTPVATKLVLYVAKPGLAIGYSGKNVKRMTQLLERDFGMKNPLLEIKTIENPQYNAQHIVNNMLNQIRRNFSWRSVVYRTLRDIDRANVAGYELVVKGKLIGKGGRKMKERKFDGYMKKVGNQASQVSMGQGDASNKSGAIGINLRLIPPGLVFPDKLTREDVLKKVDEFYKSMNEEEKTEVKEMEEEKKE